MKHGITSASRLFAGAAFSGSSAEATGREFRVTIVRPGKSVESYKRWYESGDQAALDAVRMEREGAPEGARVTMRPDLELTYAEGEAAFPFELHNDATAAARAGWQAAKLQAERRPSYRMALLQQANQINQLQASAL